MLRIQQLSKTFYPNTVNEKRIFDSLNLTVLDGEFVTIIGSNGAGKSTLLNLISGSISADSGTIFLNQEDLTHTVEYERTRFISRVFQNPTMETSPSMTTAQNLSLAKKSAKIMELTNQIVTTSNITTLMITHNLSQAITYGNRLIMLHDGHVVLDISGDEKKQLTPEKLLHQFEQNIGGQISDELLFS